MQCAVPIVSKNRDGRSKREEQRDGAGDRIRTGDIQLGRLKLYQLSYTREREEEERKWRVMDSNHRRHSRQIYSLLPLATRVTLQNGNEETKYVKY